MTNKPIHIADKNGSLTLSIDRQILTAEFSGACSVKIAKGFHAGIQILGPLFNQQPWGYLSYSKDYQAATPEVEKMYMSTYKLCAFYGCKSEAYVMPSAVGLQQIGKIRRLCGVHSDISSFKFDTLEAARQFLNNTLYSYDQEYRLASE